MPAWHAASTSCRSRAGRMARGACGAGCLRACGAGKRLAWLAACGLRAARRLRAARGLRGRGRRAAGGAASGQRRAPGVRLTGAVRGTSPVRVGPTVRRRSGALGLRRWPVVPTCADDVADVPVAARVSPRCRFAASLVVADKAHRRPAGGHADDGDARRTSRPPMGAVRRGEVPPSGRFPRDVRHGDGVAELIPESGPLRRERRRAFLPRLRSAPRRWTRRERHPAGSGALTAMASPGAPSQDRK
ncbi:hypothetical protein EDD30_5576 [Couchioplanes caeruleus]|uniref:Uncharacterized protein n=1 Tax=Couchioplanes caeruleus TaxID=56438 RepID=A0A3N1GQW8_9ACTN|nr:hypothetical protein EDD30_5576 [Couchioplanes caeruleus]